MMFSFFGEPFGLPLLTGFRREMRTAWRSATEAARALNPCIHAASKNPADGYNAALGWLKSMGKARFPQFSWYFLRVLPIFSLFSLVLT
jgi:hypothetical protein